MEDLKLIVCDNCFIIRTEYKERKCPICETGTLRVNHTKFEIGKINVDSLQDLLKQIKQPEGLKNLIEDAFKRYDHWVVSNSFRNLFEYLLLPHRKRDELETNFREIIEALFSNVISRRHSVIRNAGERIRIDDIDTLIGFEQVLKDFKEDGKWGTILVLDLIAKYDLDHKDYLIFCSNCSALYACAGQSTCILCGSTSIEDFGGKIALYKYHHEFNQEELLCLLFSYAEDYGYEKFDKLLSAFFNTQIIGYSDYASEFEDELIKSLELFRNGNYSLSDFLSELYLTKTRVYKRAGYSAEKPYSSHYSKEDIVKGGVFNDVIVEKFRTSYKNISKRSSVFGSVFSPQEVSVPSSFLVQVFIYDASHREKIEALAKSADADTIKRVELPLNNDLPIEQKLEITLIAPGLSIDQPVQPCTWNGNLNTLQFIVDVPKEYTIEDVICTIIISCEAIPIGHIKFKVKFISNDERIKELNNLQHVSHFSKYKRVFISYASEDRTEVLKRVQMLQASNVDFFQDILSLEPGERWERSLYRNIVISDAFFLFWSKAAKQSKWVRKEIIYALSVKNGREENPPEIIPIIIEGPPVPKPPKELNFLHFNDKLLYLMSR